jgi:catechol 2,3-dioxygenase-like lactoylglutathione lyase family enzyme
LVPRAGPALRTWWRALRLAVWESLQAMSDSMQPPTTVANIGVAMFAVADQDAALAFYTQKLGFSVVTDQPMGPGARWIELRIPGADTGIVLFTPDGHEDRIGTFQSISFWTNNVQKTYDELTARGVEFVAPPKTADWGTAAIFKDPDGNQFVLGSK